MTEPVNHQQAAKAKAPQGLWRDGQLLVVHRRVARLPDRCIKTNKVGPLEPFEWVARWTPVHAGLRVAGAIATQGVTNRLVSATAEEMPLTLMLDKGFMNGQRKTNYVSGGLVILGILITIGALPVLIVVTGWMPLLGMGLGCLMGLGGIVIAALGGAILLQKSEVIIDVKHMTKELAWFSGVHPDYLAALPDLPASHSILAPPVATAQS